MKLGYTILYVRDVPATLRHYERAFGCQISMLHESNMYGELDTGYTVLAFASYEMAETNGIAIHPCRPTDVAQGYEIVFVTEEVEAAFTRAIENGASQVKLPETKPWGQIVGYVRDMNGVLIEIASPMLTQHKS